MIGIVSKMKVEHISGDPAHYTFVSDKFEKKLNSFIGKQISLKFTGHRECTHCHRSIKKTYSQGYCYPCSQKLACCDLCIMKPETCHYHLGTCREPQWGETHCMIPHIVYLSVTSDLKIGITRKSQMPTRWFDQGATQAKPLFEVMTRRQSGYLEAVFKDLISDKTNWRTLLRQDNPVIDITAKSKELMEKAKSGIESVKMTFGDDAIQILEDSQIFECHYPVMQYPEKIKSLSFDKLPIIEGKLLGIKGQYLILDCGVLNIRKHTGYEVELVT